MRRSRDIQYRFCNGNIHCFNPLNTFLSMIMSRKTRCPNVVFNKNNCLPTVGIIWWQIWLGECNVPKVGKKILGCTLNAGSKGRQGSDGQDGRRLHDENSLPKFGGLRFTSLWLDTLSLDIRSLVNSPQQLSCKESESISCVDALCRKITGQTALSVTCNYLIWTDLIWTFLFTVFFWVLL